MHFDYENVRKLHMTAIVLGIAGTAIKSGIYLNNTLTNIKETPTEASLGGAQVFVRLK